MQPSECCAITCAWNDIAELIARELRPAALKARLQRMTDNITFDKYDDRTGEMLGATQMKRRLYLFALGKAC